MNIKSSAILKAEIHLILTENEAAALNALSLYNVEDFLKFFYTSLGKTYLQPHEEGFRSLIKNVKNEMPSHLNKFNKAREIFQK